MEKPKVCAFCGNLISENLEQGLLNEAGHVSVSFGYGSQYDADAYEGYIHDVCFEKAFIRGAFEYSNFLTSGRMADIDNASTKLDEK